MYKIKWDTNNNSILLDDKSSEKESIVPPRPVFFEELDLLGFDKHWEYPKSEAPLLWSVGRRYYYHGKLVAEAKGGDIYEAPELEIHHHGRLEPIDIDLVIEKNKDAIFKLENEAMDFVEHIHKVYKKQVDYFTVAFSGGKDSQVVLDIVSRVLAPEDFITLFTDTGMEIPFTYQNIIETEKLYQKTYRGFKIRTAKPPGDTLDFWKKFGPPSRIQRWCCTVCKTAPYANFLRTYHNSIKENGQPAILVYEGVRADESDRRSKYNRITTDTKSMRQINAEAILFWNNAEIFLYLFQRNLILNEGYRYGLNRIGCSICPYGSKWSENIIKRIAPVESQNFIKIIEDFGRFETKSTDALKKYIKQESWKKRAGGRHFDKNGRSVDIIQKNSNIIGILRKPQENFLEWMKTIGNEIHKNDSQKLIGEFKINKELFDFEIETIDNDSLVITINGIARDIVSLNKIKKIFHKTTHCIHCGACEAECPTGALTVNPSVKINKKACIHCSHCLNYTGKGCLVAKSIAVTEKGRKMKKGKIATSKYQTFGLRKEWLREYLVNPDFFFKSNNLRLGNRQLESMVVWLKDSNLLNAKKIPTKLAKILKRINMSSEKLVWEIVWINLFYSVELIQWYIDNFKWNSTKTTKELIEQILSYSEYNKQRTTSNAVNSLVNMFDNSPLGGELGVGVIEKKNRLRYLKKNGTENINPISIAYCLYIYSENTKQFDHNVSRFYKDDCFGGPYKLFGISKEKFENILRYLQENANGIVSVELSADLENIFLREELNSNDILDILIN